MSLRNKTVAVTGAAGFLGSWLCPRLIEEGAKVVALDINPNGAKENLAPIADQIDYHVGDIRDPTSLRAIRDSHIVYHLAAIANVRVCRENLDDTFNVNIAGTKNTLQNSIGADRFVFLSTIMVYGEPLYLPLDERHPANGADPYAVSKLSGELLLRTFYEKHELPYTIIRNANSFGPRQDKAYLIPTLINEALTKGHIDIWNARHVRDFMYVENTIDALLAVVGADATTNEILNLGSGKGVAAGTLADRVSQTLGVTWGVGKKMPLTVPKLVSDPSKIRALTGWQPRIDLDEGLRRTIDYATGSAASPTPGTTVKRVA